MEIETTFCVYRDKYLFGERVHKILESIVGTSILFKYGLAEEEEIELDISATYYPGEEPRLHGRMEDCYPGSAASIDDLEATLNGVPFALLNSEIEAAEEAIHETAINNMEDDYDPPDRYDDYDDYDYDCDYWNRCR